ncbi:MAG: hypothetical protein ABJB69_04530 [Spartobacteria bacterium]
MKFSLLIFFVCQSLAMAFSMNRVPNFELNDQHETLRSYRFPKTKVTVMTVADYKGAGQLEPWLAHVYQRFGRKIDIDGVADVSGIPRPFQGALRIAFRNQLAYSVMLDWDGAVTRGFHYEKGVANIYVIDSQGMIIGRFGGAATENSLQQLTLAIEHTINRR